MGSAKNEMCRCTRNVATKSAPTQANNGVVRSWADCATQCKLSPKCHAWVLEEHGDKLCHLKSKIRIMSGAEYSKRGGYVGGLNVQCDMHHSETTPAADTTTTTATGTKVPTEVATKAATSTATTATTTAPTKTTKQAPTQAPTRAPSDAPTDTITDDTSNQCMHHNRFYFGKTYASLAPSQSNNGFAWTWSECAMQCKFSTKCHVWVLEERGTKLCHLRSTVRIISGAEYATRGGFIGGVNLYACDMPTTTAATEPSASEGNRILQGITTEARTPVPIQSATRPEPNEPVMPSTTETPKLTSTYDCPCAHKDRFYFGRTIKKLAMPGIPYVFHTGSSNVASSGGAKWLANDCWKICATRDQCAAWVIASNVCLLKSVDGGYSIFRSTFELLCLRTLPGASA